MEHVNRVAYPYMEEINEGVLRQFPAAGANGQRVLDVGCGRGQLGEAVTRRGYRVWGVENNPEAVAGATPRLERVVAADCTDFARVHAELPPEPFDAIIFSDVLEHLYDPRTIVEEYLQHLRPGGRVIVSVPNAVAWTQRLNWLRGVVRYEDTGIMDRTHIRFFTFTSAQRLLRACGLEIERVDCTPYLVRALLPLIKGLLGKGGGPANPRALIDSPLFKVYQKLVYPPELLVTRLWRGMFAFRILVVARKPAV